MNCRKLWHQDTQTQKGYSEEQFSVQYHYSDMPGKYTTLGTSVFGSLRGALKFASTASSTKAHFASIQNLLTKETFYIPLFARS